MPRNVSWTPPSTPFTATHVAPLGVTEAMLRWAEQSGAITRLTHGVFVATGAVPADPNARHLQRALALQLRNPSAIASHHTAALAWDLDLNDALTASAAAPAFIAPAGPGLRSKAHRGLTIAIRDLPTHHRTEHPSGLLVTTRPYSRGRGVTVRTARGAHHARLRCPTRAAQPGGRAPTPPCLRQREADRDLSSAPERGQRTRSDATHAPQPGRCRPNGRPAEGVGQRVTELRSFRDRGVTSAPGCQAHIRTPAGDTFPDFLWMDAMVVGEADGAVKYTSREDLVREKLRQEALEQMGFRIVRWMYSEIRQRPAAVVSRIAAALDARGAL